MYVNSASFRSWGNRDLAHAPWRDNCSDRALTPAIYKGKYQIKG